MTPTAPHTWASAERLKAVNLNRESQAIRELQAGGQRTYTEQAVLTGVSLATGGGTSRDFGSIWANSGTYVAGGTVVSLLGTGLLAPAGGIYSLHTFVSLAVQPSGRAYLEWRNGSASSGTIVARLSMEHSITETYFAMTTVGQFNSGDLMTPTYYQTNGATITANNVTIRVARLAP